MAGDTIAVNLGEYFIKIYSHALQHGINFSSFYTAYWPAWGYL